MFLILFYHLSFAQLQYSEYNSMAGAFSRMGFGARGMGMGNSMGAVIQGNLVSYYNPAVSVFQEKNYFHTSYSILSLDRSLNFLNFTRQFNFGKDDKNDSKLKSISGISLGIINAGISGIERRDRQGIKYKDLSTSENQFFLNFSKTFSDNLSIGVGLKFFYYSLYEDISSSGFGIDLGAVYRFNNNLTFAGVITDINSKYKWDTTTMYGIEGNSTTYSFPTLYKIAASYKFNNPDLLVNMEFEHSNAETNFIRVGAEYNIYQSFYLRSGIDRISLSNTDIPIRPAFGFSYFKAFNKLNIGIDYAFVVEPYSSFDQHIIGIEVLF
ncbi:MAG: hypothetical protein CR986_07485 [Ignavibacteriae bacterium]|nr:MAG: hypothetical protein CR986_07485 [Ignavibacteriota bacterium]